MTARKLSEVPELNVKLEGEKILSLNLIGKSFLVKSFTVRESGKKYQREAGETARTYAQLQCAFVDNKGVETPFYTSTGSSAVMRKLKEAKTFLPLLVTLKQGKNDVGQNYLYLE